MGYPVHVKMYIEWSPGRIIGTFVSPGALQVNNVPYFPLRKYSLLSSKGFLGKSRDTMKDNISALRVYQTKYSHLKNSCILSWFTGTTVSPLMQFVMVNSAKILLDDLTWDRPVNWVNMVDLEESAA